VLIAAKLKVAASVVATGAPIKSIPATTGSLTKVSRVSPGGTIDVISSYEVMLVSVSVAKTAPALCAMSPGIAVIACRFPVARLVAMICPYPIWLATT